GNTTAITGPLPETLTEPPPERSEAKHHITKAVTSEKLEARWCGGPNAAPHTTTCGGPPKVTGKLPSAAALARAPPCRSPVVWLTTALHHK
ncbi:hypothetical protein A2U01_0052871, partial [Trifolium medium]|nr:hypothetical protein [Trifolium medium]